MSLTAALPQPVEETIHGIVVRDPYRWLEDRTSRQTEDWIKNQRTCCDQYFAGCADMGAVRRRVREYLDGTVTDQPTRVQDQYFFRRRNPGEEQGSIYTSDIARVGERLLVDPSPLGPFASVSIYRISEDASLLAYGLRTCGSDRQSIHIVDVEHRQTHADGIAAGYTRGLVFASDNGGYYYCHEIPDGNVEHTICLRRFDRTPTDRVCLRMPRTPGSCLVLGGSRTCLSALHVYRIKDEDVADLWIADQAAPARWHRIFAKRPLPFSPFLRLGRMFGLSYEAAPNGKFVEFDGSGDEVGAIIPEQKGMVRQLFMVRDSIILKRMDGTNTSIEAWSLAGDLCARLDFRNDSTVRILPPQNDSAASIFYTCESLTDPPAIFEYLIEDATARLWHQTSSAAASVRCSVERTQYPSSDGTPIPITLAVPDSCRTLKEQPVLMTSYGGFGVAMTPQFSVLVAMMTEAGAAFAMPGIRGGGECGKPWHEAARGRKRQVGVDDFIAAAEWLCSSRMTRPDRLAIFGGSNSGLLVAAAMAQRPRLFRAVLCIAPLLDMVRYESFDQAIKWRQEYGSVEDPDEFRALYDCSPYHHVAEDMNYPSVLFVSGDSDDRCSPAHVRKMAARLKAREAQINPIIVDYSEERGHSPVLPLSVRTEALTRRIAFLCRELGIRPHFGGHDESTGN
jgi:prolyl oligopeptidase